MKRHLIRAAVTFAASMACYLVYSLIVAPILDPSGFRAADSSGSGAFLSPADRPQLAGYFPEGAWERDRPKVLTTRQGKLLLKEYVVQPDGRLQLIPCTIVLEDSGEDAAEPAPPVIIRSPGALLDFDRPLELTGGGVGNLERGLLDGPVQIYRRATPPETGNDLEIDTGDVQLDQSHVFCPSDVDFRLGRDFGRGRDLTIELIPKAAAKTGGGPAFEGMRLLRLAHVEKVTMHMQKDGLFSGASNAGKDSSAAAGPELTPVEITCRGPFTLDVERQIAWFEDRVVVMRRSAAGPPDSLACDRLEIHLMRGQEGEGNSGGPLKDLNPRRLVAIGRPVVLRAPTYGAFARGTRLEYDLISDEVVLEDDDQAMLKDERQQIEARRIRYVPGEEGRLGRMWAAGPGSFRGRSSDDGDWLEASWRDQLLLRPHEDRHVLSLIGAASVRTEETGGFSAEEIHLWLLETPRAKKTPREQPAADAEPRLPGIAGEFDVSPDRMLALRNVKIDSPQLTGDTERLEAWFINFGPAKLAGEPVVVPGTFLRRPAAGPLEPRRPLAPAGPRTLAGPISATTRRVVALRPADPFASLASDGQRFDLHGKLIRVQLSRQGEETVVDDVTVEEDVRLIETAGAEPGEAPLTIHGDFLHIRGGSRPNAVAEVHGRPARVAARGLTMFGDAIFLDRGRNRLWIPGPGKMTLPADQNRPVTEEAYTEIDWGKRMDFDGQLILFDDQVRLRRREIDEQGRPSLSFGSGRQLAVNLSSRVDFSRRDSRRDRPDEQPKVQAKKIEYTGQVELENRRLTRRGELDSVQRFYVPGLTVDQISGEMTAAGPGRLVSWSTGAADPLAAAAAPARETGDGEDEGVKFLEVRYERAIAGNTLRRESTFFGQVRAVYGPVAGFGDVLDADRIGGLSPEGVALNCDELSVYEMGPAAASARGAVEMIAAGNIYIEGFMEGRSFEATAARLKYTEDKALMILEGDSRSDAALSRQEVVGGPRSRAKARRILYWPRIPQVQAGDASSINISQQPQEPSSSPPR